MIRVVQTTATEIRLEDEGGGFFFAVDINHEKGVRSTSGKLIAERGDGQRVDINALELLSTVYEIGFTHGMKGRG